MKLLRYSILFLLFLIPTTIFAQYVSVIDDRAILFSNVNVVPMTDQNVIPGMDVLIEGDRISRIGQTGELSVPHGTEVINAEGKYLLPGLAEMHGHVPPVQSDSWPERYLEDVFFLYLAGGVTTVRGMLGHPNQLELREQVNNSSILGPTLYLAGPSFSGGSINSPEQAAERVNQQFEEGWDLLKIHPGLSLEEYTAMAEAANEVGMEFSGHVPAEVGLENAIMLGQRTIDHLDGYIEYIGAMEEPVTKEQLNKAVALTVENDVWVVPTQALWKTLLGAADHDKLMEYDEIKYMPNEVVNGWLNYLNNQQNTFFYRGEHAAVHQENRQKLLKALQDGEANILLGTDAPQIFSVPGLSMKHELTIMEQAGLTPYEILKSGTYNVGVYFREWDNFGIITENNRADLILTNDNPLENLSTIEDHAGVMVRGIWISREAIDKKLKEIEEAYRD